MFTDNNVLLIVLVVVLVIIIYNGFFNDNLATNVVNTLNKSTYYVLDRSGKIIKRSVNYAGDGFDYLVDESGKIIKRVTDSSERGINYVVGSTPNLTGGRVGYLVDGTANLAQEGVDFVTDSAGNIIKTSVGVVENGVNYVVDSTGKLVSAVGRPIGSALSYTAGAIDQGSHYIYDTVTGSPRRISSNGESSDSVVSQEETHADVDETGSVCGGNLLGTNGGLPLGHYQDEDAFGVAMGTCPMSEERVGNPQKDVVENFKQY